MDIQHKQTGNNGSFFAESNGKTVAEMTYTLENDIMTIGHTESAPELKAECGDAAFRYSRAICPR